MDCIQLQLQLQLQPETATLHKHASAGDISTTSTNTQNLDELEYLASKRRRTTPMSKGRRIEVHKLCALAIAVDVDLFGHLARSSPAGVPMVQLAAVTGVEAQLLDTIIRTLAADSWLIEVKPDCFAANKVTHAMTDPDFQSLVAHCLEMGLPAVLATPRFLSNIDYRAPLDSFLLAWHVSQATSLGLLDYVNQSEA